MLPTATLCCELDTATRSVKKIVYGVFIVSARKEVDECRGECGVSMWVSARLLSNNSSESNTKHIVV